MVKPEHGWGICPTWRVLMRQLTCTSTSLWYSLLFYIFASFLLVRPKAIACGVGLCFSADVFFHREISEMRGPTGVKFCTMVICRPNFIMPIQNFGAHPKKISGAKNMQNLAWFQTSLKFVDEYLRNGRRYSKSDKYFIYGDSSRVRRNKFGEVWSSNFGDLDVKSCPPKAHFSEEHISALGGAAPPNFYTR